jgi:hypothetical protein
VNKGSCMIPLLTCYLVVTVPARTSRKERSTRCSSCHRRAPSPRLRPSKLRLGGAAGGGFVPFRSGCQEYSYYGCHEQRAAQFCPRHDGLRGSRHPLEQPARAEGTSRWSTSGHARRTHHCYRTRPGPKIIHQ